MTIQDEPTVVLYDAANAEWVHFEHPQRVVEVASLEQILPALQEIERLVELNAWYAAGFVSYEAAPAFDTALVTRHAAGFPLLWFGLYSAPRRTDRPPAWDAQYSLAGRKPAVTAASYERAIAQIKLQIGRGETYQVNHTFRMRSRFAGDPRGLFGDMLDPQSPGYAGFIDTGTHAICCASPELFSGGTVNVSNAGR